MLYLQKPFIVIFALLSIYEAWFLDNSAVSDEVRVVDDAKKDDAEDVVMVEDDSDEPEVDAKPDAIELSSWAIKYLENCLVVEGQRR